MANEKDDGIGCASYLILSELLGIPIASETDIIRLAEKGLPLEAYTNLSRRLNVKSALRYGSVLRVVALSGGGRLSEAASIRTLRLAEVYAMAVYVFGDESMALSWFTHPMTFRQGSPPRAPITIASTLGGAALMSSRIRRTANFII